MKKYTLILSFTALTIQAEQFENPEKLTKPETNEIPRIERQGAQNQRKIQDDKDTLFALSTIAVLTTYCTAQTIMSLWNAYVNSTNQVHQ